MTKNIIWKTFIAAPAGVALFFGIKTCILAWEYAALSARTEATELLWSVVPKNSSFYTLQASYRFNLEGKTLQGTTTFTTKPSYPNEWAAAYDIQKLQGEKWEVFYNPKKPEKNSLARFFPFQPLLYTALSLSLSLYFTFLRFYTSRSDKISDFAE